MAPRLYAQQDDQAQQGLVRVARRPAGDARKAAHLLAESPSSARPPAEKNRVPPTAALDARQDAVERPRDALEVECLDQKHGVPLLAVPHEAVQLFLERPGAVRGLLL